MKLINILLEEERESNIDIEHVDIMYTTDSKFYSAYVHLKDGTRKKMWVGEFEKLLKKLGIEENIPWNSNLKNVPVLDSIVDQLKAQGISASWDETMDVS